MRKLILKIRSHPIDLALYLVKPKFVLNWIKDNSPLGYAGSIRTPLLFLCYITRNKKCLALKNNK